MCLSVRIEHLSPHGTDFRKILRLSIFRKYVVEFKVSFQSDKSNGCFTRRPVQFYEKCLAELFLEWKIFATKLKPKTHI